MLLFKSLSKESLKGTGINTKKLNVFTQSSVFEDNDGVLLVSSSPLLNPTSKFVDVK